MKPFFIMAYASIGLMLAAVFFSFFSNQDQAATVESVYKVKVITKEVHFTGPNKLIIEREGQRLTCDSPSPGDLKNKTPLSCAAPTPVTKIDAQN